VTLRLQHRSNPEVNINVEAHIIPRITGKIPTGPVPLESCAQFSGLDLADPSFNVPGHVDILLGANIYAHLLNEEIRRTDLQAPVAQRTVFGWIISGPLPGSYSRIATSSQGYCCVPDRELHGLVKRFWEQEDVPAREESKMSTDDRACETHFGSTHSRDSDGRYTVRLPFKSVLTGQEESRLIAKRMLARMQERFLQDPKLKKLYVDFMTEYLTLGHREEIKPSDLDQAYFLPHHGVLHDSSISTKLRVVFNGSQNLSSGKALNDTLYAGPKLQIDLTDVLLRWRFFLPTVFLQM